MIETPRTLARLAIILIASLAATGAPALAQEKPCEQRIKEAEEQLRQMENRLKDLARENDRLRKENTDLKAGGGGSGGGKDSKPKQDAGPAQPLASPDALFQALVKNFEEKVASLPRETKPEQVKFAGAAKKWAADATREFRGPVEWLIQVVKVDGGPGASARPADVTFQVLDLTGKPVGEPVTQPIPGRFIKELSEDAGKKTYKLSGTFGAKPTHNPRRAEKGATDEPRFIGPFTEFGYDLAVQNIVEEK